MLLESDLLIERQKMRRRLILWRCIAIGIFAFSICAISAKQLSSSLGKVGDHLVKLKVEGTIKSDVSKQVQLINSALEDKSVKGMILYVNSPGGTVTGGEQLHDAILRFSKGKPVVVTMGGVAASAGYMISVPAKRIFAFNSTLTGSIGVLMESPDFSKLLDKVGISVDQLVSGPLKGQPSMVKPLSLQGQKMLQGLIGNFYDQFVSMVASGRHMDQAKVRALGDGRPYSGQQALQLGLIDQIGNEDDAKDWLIKTYHFSSMIKVTDLKEETSSDWLSSFIKTASSISMRNMIAGVIYEKNTDFDGIQAIWKP